MKISSSSNNFLLKIIEVDKGQIVSDKIAVSWIIQKCNEIIAMISSLASKMGQIKKIKALCYIKFTW